MDIVGFILIGIGASLWNFVGLRFLIGGVFMARAGSWMRHGGPSPSLMKPPATENERIKVGNAGIVFGSLKAIAGTAMLGFMSVIASRDWHLWGQTISLLGESSSPYLEILGLFVTSTTAAAIYPSVHVLREQYLPSKELRQGKVRMDIDPRTTQSRGRGLVVISAGTILCVMSAAPSIYLTVEVFVFTPPPYVEITPLIVVLSGPIYAAGLNVSRKGRRHFVPIITNHEELEIDSFILYLRRFKEDALLDRAYPRSGSPFLNHFIISGASEEERLANVLKPYGRLIAVGDPTEDLPRVGADRFYLPIEGWQSPVRELISKARLVVLSLGMGEGTLWELVEAMSMLPPERLIILVPMDEEDYETFRREARKRLEDRAKKVRATGGSWTPPTLPEYRRDPRIRHSDLLELYRGATKKTASDSLWETATEAMGVGLNFGLNFEIRSAFKAVIYYPCPIGDMHWGEPIFSRLESLIYDSWWAALLCDPRYVALKSSLRPALLHAFRK